MASQETVWQLLQLLVQHVPKETHAWLACEAGEMLQRGALARYVVWVPAAGPGLAFPPAGLEATAGVLL
jgi:hypothetical protein